jgi:hypothetical protein
VFLLDSLLVGGVRFVLDKVATAVDGELNNEGGLREQLLAAQMQFELGEIEEEELIAIERGVMTRLREIRESRMEGTGIGIPSDARVVGVEVTFDAAEPGEDFGGPYRRDR